MEAKKIGARIKELRKFLKRVTQNEMALDLGMYQPDISALENAKKGSGITDLDKLQMVADYLGVSLQELMFGSGLESQMQRYQPEKMKIQWAGKKAKPLPQMRDCLCNYYHLKPEQAEPLIYYCGNYVIYAMRENLISWKTEQPSFGYARVHLLVTLEDRIIAAADADNLPLMFFIHQPSFLQLQEMMDSQILDVSDVLRTLNPYVPLVKFTKDPVTRQNYRKKMWERMQALMELKDQESVVLIENLYVLQECRQKGICRMLVDAVRELLKAETIWLNLEPLDYDSLYYLEGGNPVPEIYTREEVKQIAANSGIAEMLGFTVDPDGWTRPVGMIDDPDHSFIKMVRIRKTAYCLSPALRKVVDYDGDLIMRGRAAQVMEQASEEPAYTGPVEFRYRMLGQKILAELPASEESFLVGLLDQDGEIQIAFSETSIEGERNVISSMFHWISPEELESADDEPEDGEPEDDELGVGDMEDALGEIRDMLRPILYFLLQNMTPGI